MLEPQSELHLPRVGEFYTGLKAFAGAIRSAELRLGWCSSYTCTSTSVDALVKPRMSLLQQRLLFEDCLKYALVNPVSLILYKYF